MKPLDPDAEKISDLQHQVNNLKIEYWLKHDLFKAHWWILLAATIIPWLIWWKIADRKRFHDLIIYGLIWVIFSTILDNIGYSLNLWQYPKELFSFVPTLLPANTTIIPVSFMLIYQYFPKGKGFFWGNMGVSLGFAYLIEPIFIWFHLFKPADSWNHNYTFSLFLLLAYFIRWITKKLKQN